MSTWLPLLFALHALWPERGSRRQDLLLRATPVVWPAWRSSSCLRCSARRACTTCCRTSTGPRCRPTGTALAQLPTVAFVVAPLALGWQAWRQPRPLHTAMLVALLCLWWMLPSVFLPPALLPALASTALLLMVAATLQESFHMAYRDELTGLPGRRALNESLKRAATTYTIAMVDVDHFKRFNDTHGHDTGDDVLKLVASRFARVGDGGRAFRYGGEEFAVVFLDRRPRRAWTRWRRSGHVEGTPPATARPRRAGPRRCGGTAATRARRWRYGSAGDRQHRHGRQPGGRRPPGCSKRPTRRCMRPRTTAATAYARTASTCVAVRSREAAQGSASR